MSKTVQVEIKITRVIHQSNSWNYSENGGREGASWSHTTQLQDPQVNLVGGGYWSCVVFEHTTLSFFQEFLVIFSKTMLCSRSLIYNNHKQMLQEASMPLSLSRLVAVTYLDKFALWAHRESRASSHICVTVYMQLRLIYNVEWMYRLHHYLKRFKAFFEIVI